MRVYELEVDHGYRVLELLDKDHSNADNQFDEFIYKRKLAVNWITAKVDYMSVKEVKGEFPGKCKSDYIYVCDAGENVLSQHLVDQLGDYLRQFGELLPVVDKDGYYYYAYHVLHEVDALDLQNCEYADWVNKECISWIKKYTFKPEMLTKNVDIFIVPDLGTSSVFVTDRFVKIIEDGGFTGFEFDLLWSDDPADSKFIRFVLRPNSEKSHNKAIGMVSQNDFYLDLVTGKILKDFNTQKPDDADSDELQLFNLTTIQKVELKSLLFNAINYLEIDDTKLGFQDYNDFILNSINAQMKILVTEVKINITTYDLLIMLAVIWGDHIRRYLKWDWIYASKNMNITNDSNIKVNADHSSLLDHCILTSPDRKYIVIPLCCVHDQFTNLKTNQDTNIELLSSMIMAKNFPLAEPYSYTSLS